MERRSLRDSAAARSIRRSRWWPWPPSPSASGRPRRCSAILRACCSRCLPLAEPGPARPGHAGARPMASPTNAGRPSASGWPGGGGAPLNGRHCMAWTFNFLVRGDGSRSLRLHWAYLRPTTSTWWASGAFVGRALTVAEASRPGVDNQPGAPPTGNPARLPPLEREFAGDKDIVGRAVTLSRMPAPLPVLA